MPSYDFRCEKCTSAFSESLPMGTNFFPVCPTCKTNVSVKKLVRAPMVHFKGSGFYKTDSKGSLKHTPKDTGEKPVTKEHAETAPAVKKNTETAVADTKPSVPNPAKP